jgi:phosphate starvation-inducible PhoH-like protein
MSRTSRPKKKPVQERPLVRAKGRTVNQEEYIEDMLNNDYVICIGPAGTGKTHLAAGIGAENLIDKTVKRLILTRPCVATEKIGFLPGDQEAKIHPYLIPLFDELNYFIDVDHYMRTKQVFIEPIAFLRGRTIKDSFIIVDEAQNCTFNQLKMIATRLGEGSQMVVNGDPDQSDLPSFGEGSSGLGDFVRLIENDPACQDGIITVRTFTKADIVRHPSVSVILNALEKKGQ